MKRNLLDFMQLPRTILSSIVRQSIRPHQLFVTSLHQRAFSRTVGVMANEFKLKGLTSLDLKNGQMKEVEVEGIEEGKVLLAKVKDQVHALSHKCTHYGAPLAKGILTGDGRITCPWHGACFNVKTGDIEDSPAPDPLQKFEIVEKDGGVYIKGEQSAIKAGRRALSIKCQSKGNDRVVVVGGGSGAFGAIEGLRAGGFTGFITCISNEPHPPIDRTKLSKGLVNDASKVTFRSADFYKEGDVDMVTDTVTSVDFGGKKVTTQGGKEYKYTKLILATGGIPRMLPLPGLKGDLKNVYPLRYISDVQDILKAAGEEGGKKIVVIGSSFIGMEVGNALASKQHDISIIGMENEPMERVMGEKVGAIFRSLLEKNGVKFYMNASVEKGEATTGDTSNIGSVHLKNGQSLPADLVIEGVGVRPGTDYLKNNSAVQLEKDGSIATDDTFAVNGLKDVYAVGDIATYPYHGPGGNGKPVRIEHWNVAQNAGRSVAKLINNPRSKPEHFIPVFWSAVGAQMRYCGHTPNGFDDVIIQGNTDTSEGKQSFVAYYAKGEEIHAVATMAKVGSHPVISLLTKANKRL